MWTNRLKKLLIWSFCACLMVISIAFSGRRQSEKMVKDLYIEIDNQYQNYFVDTEDVRDLINSHDDGYLLSTSLANLDLKQIESRVRHNEFVSDVDAYTDHHGNLVVSVKQCRPIARIFDPQGADFYIGANGEILPMSTKYTARVMLVHLDNKKKYLHSNLKMTEHGAQLFELISYIDSHPFWKAQIAEVAVDSHMDFKLYPQVTKQEIILGNADELDTKFRKLMVFYKEILPVKGWNGYDRVNLKFANQIVCE